MTTSLISKPQIAASRQDKPQLPPSSSQSTPQRQHLTCSLYVMYFFLLHFSMPSGCVGCRFPVESREYQALWRHHGYSVSRALFLDRLLERCFSFRDHRLPHSTPYPITPRPISPACLPSGPGLSLSASTPTLLVSCSHRIHISDFESQSLLCCKL